LGLLNLGRLGHKERRSPERDDGGLKIGEGRTGIEEGVATSIRSRGVRATSAMGGERKEKRRELGEYLGQKKKRLRAVPRAYSVLRGVRPIVKKNSGAGSREFLWWDWEGGRTGGNLLWSFYPDKLASEKFKRVSLLVQGKNAGGPALGRECPLGYRGLSSSLLRSRAKMERKKGREGEQRET